jgi:transposase
MRREAEIVRLHKDLILNFFIAKEAFSFGVVEGTNTKVKLTERKFYSFRAYKCTDISLYQVLRKLPAAELAREFY